MSKADTRVQGWTLVYEGFEPAREGLREALCTLGNGYFATRGALAHARADSVHYPGTYLAGGYNRLESEVAGLTLRHEDLVNMPNWLLLELRIDAGPWLKLSDATLEGYTQTLELGRGLLTRELRVRDAEDRRLRITERRLVHIAQPHLAALELELMPENFEGRIEIRSVLDGHVVNAGVERYRDLENRHLEPVAAYTADAETLMLKMRTSQSRIEIAQAARTRLFDAAGARAPAAEHDDCETGFAARRFVLDVEPGRPVRVEKTVAMYTTRDHAVSECGLAARKAVARAPGFEALLESHALRWRQLWQRFDIGIEETGATDAESLTILRLHIFHLLQTASPHTKDLDVGVPARGWHGEAYRGHIFWDELFIFPLLNWRLPEITRALLMYRYRRLDEARANARAVGHAGALYPWRSGSDGSEETQRFQLNPVSGRWIPDDTELQRHINSAIAYNVWQYYEATRDIEFLCYAGAEIFLEIARFWGDYAVYNEARGRYELLGVAGPDEFHTRYPDRDEPGLDNNAYTNVLAAWVLARAGELLELLPEERRVELCEQLGLGSDELALWDRVSRLLYVPIGDDGIISQFEGFEALEELDWQRYRDKYGDIHRLERLLEAEGDDVNRYKAVKQADVLMLFYLFSAEELGELFARLGYAFGHDTIPRNVAYYSPRTSHGSTLSRVVHSWVTARSDREGSWRLFKQALVSDVADIQGGTTPEGIHLGAMAGTVDLLQRAYTGIVTRGDTLWINPRLPRELTCLRMTIRYRGHALDITISHTWLTVHARRSNAAPIELGIVDGTHWLEAGATREFALDAD